MRIVIQQLSIFLLPLLLYAAYLLWRRRQARMAGDPVPPWEQGQWFWAIVAGLALSIAVFLILAIIGDATEGPFRPPSWKR